MLIILSLVIVSLVIVSMVTLSLHCLSNHCNANHCLSSHCLSGHCLSGHSLSWLSLSSHCLVSTRTILSCPAICVYSHYLILPSLVILSIVLCLHALSYLALHSLSPSSLSLVSTRTISSCPAIFLFAWSVYSLVSSLCILRVYCSVLQCVAGLQCALVGQQSVWVVQCVAMCCSVYLLDSSLCILCLYFSVLQCVAVLQCVFIGQQSVYSVWLLQCVAVCCSVAVCIHWSAVCVFCVCISECCIVLQCFSVHALVGSLCTLSIRQSERKLLDTISCSTTISWSHTHAQSIYSMYSAVWMHIAVFSPPYSFVFLFQHTQTLVGSGSVSHSCSRLTFCAHTHTSSRPSIYSAIWIDLAKIARIFSLSRRTIHCVCRLSVFVHTNICVCRCTQTSVYVAPTAHKVRRKEEER